MHEDQLLTQLQSLISERLMVRVDSPDKDLLATGVLDSMSLVELLMALEERFGVTLNPADLEVEAFRSVRSIAGLVTANTRAQVRTAP